MVMVIMHTGKHDSCLGSVAVCAANDTECRVLDAAIYSESAACHAHPNVALTLAKPFKIRDIGSRREAFKIGGARLLLCASAVGFPTIC